MKQASLFMNGSSQAVRLPKEMRYSGDKVFIEKINGVTIIVDQEDPWAALNLAQALSKITGFLQEREPVGPIKERAELQKMFSEKDKTPKSKRKRASR